MHILNGLNSFTVYPPNLYIKSGYICEETKSIKVGILVLNIRIRLVFFGLLCKTTEK